MTRCIAAPIALVLLAARAAPTTLRTNQLIAPAPLARVIPPAQPPITRACLVVPCAYGASPVIRLDDE